jgi:hypothetical protein
MMTEQEEVRGLKYETDRVVEKIDRHLKEY